jgi:hypothetical protein
VRPVKKLFSIYYYGYKLILFRKGGSVEDNEMAGPSSRTRTSVNNKKRVEFADRRLFSGNDSIERQSSVKQSTTQPSSDQDLFDKLEEAYQVSVFLCVIK